MLFTANNSSMIIFFIFPGLVTFDGANFCFFSGLCCEITQNLNNCQTIFARLRL